MALACTWNGFADTDIDFSSFFAADHTVSVRFMLQFPRAYAGPMLSVNGTGTFFLGQRYFANNPGDPPDLLLRVGANEVAVATNLTAGTWHHLAAARSGNSYRVYLDGNDVGLSLVVPSSGAPAGTLRFGKEAFDPALDGGGSQFYGLLDDVGVFDAALSAAEVAALSNANRLSGSENHLISGYVFGYQPSGGLPAKLSRPLTRSVGATIVGVSDDRNSAVDAKRLPLASSSFMHLPFLAGTQWEVKQGYQGATGWNSHNGYAAFALDFIVAEAGVSEADRIAKTEGKPFNCVAHGDVAWLQDVFAAGGPSNFMSIRHAPLEFSDYLHSVNSSAKVSVGQQVGDGVELAAMGDTGTGPFHLHFAVTNLGEGGKNSGGEFRTIPAPFSNYEYSEDEGNSWHHVIRGIPLEGQWVRRAVSTTPVRFSAVWRPGTEGEIQVYDWALGDLRKKYDELWPKGWRLRILAPYVVDGRVRFAAVWRPSTEGEIQVYDWALADVRKKYDELWPKGWRLKILAPYVVKGHVRFAAVWRPGTEGEIQVYDWALADVRKKYDELWPQGLRLEILAPYVVNGHVRFAAVWRPSTEGEIQVYDWALADLRKKYDELWPQGLRLAILAPYVVNGQVRYAAVWKPSTEGELQVYGWEYADLRAYYDGLWHHGLRLAHLEPYVL